MGGVGDEEFAALGGLHGGRGVEDGFEVAVFGEELAGGFGTDAGHAGDVVDAVAHEGEEIDHVFGAAAEFLADFVGADELLLDGVLHLDAGADELHQVLVGGHDGDLAAGVGGGEGVGGDEVVGFPVFQFDGGDAKGEGGFADEGELGAEFFWRFGALGFVLVVEAVAEGVAPGVEDDGEVGAGVVLHQPGEHVGEAEHGVHWGAVRPRHGGERVEGAEDEARAVDEHQMHVSARRRRQRRR